VFDWFVLVIFCFAVSLNYTNPSRYIFTAEKILFYRGSDETALQVALFSKMQFRLPVFCMENEVRYVLDVAVGVYAYTPYFSIGGRD